MNNIEKAREIQDESEGYVLMSKSGAALWSAKRMAEWKDQQFEKVIEYTETCYGVFSFNEREKFIENIKKIYRGEEL